LQQALEDISLLATKIKPKGKPMKTNITLSLLTAIAIALIGCGGAGDTPGASTGNSGQSGNVGDGYIEGAYVCHDRDNDMDCLDETYATTDANGAFVLSNYDASQALLVQIPVGAVDNGPFTDGSTTPRPFTQQTWYYYPAQAAPANSPIFIGPLSTLVYAQTENIPGISTEDAANSVASSLGIEGSQVLGNYLEDNSPRALKPILSESLSVQVWQTTLHQQFHPTLMVDICRISLPTVMISRRQLQRMILPPMIRVPTMLPVRTGQHPRVELYKTSHRLLISVVT
jgi:hypothetical protein